MISSTVGWLLFFVLFVFFVLLSVTSVLRSRFLGQQSFRMTASTACVFFLYFVAFYLMWTPASQGDGSICMEEAAFGLFGDADSNYLPTGYTGPWTCQIAQWARVLIALAISVVPTLFIGFSYLKARRATGTKQLWHH